MKRARGVLLLAACVLAGCDEPFVVDRCAPWGDGVAPGREREAADFVLRCVDSGGRGVRSTEAWIEECRASAQKLYCLREPYVSDGSGTVSCRYANKPALVRACDRARRAPPPVASPSPSASAR